ncbi:hypothetical protein BDR05DRAFT_970742 [Suillus weaverae]|nr:hypothetical protein BDR05DRAFT_970742 [Suillus weaverae]
MLGPLRLVLHIFNLQALTAREDAMRVVRACVGKTSLITILAMLSGYQLCRSNGSSGEFAWKDAEFLTATQEGHRVLLDEMNLAPRLSSRGLMLFWTTKPHRLGLVTSLMHCNK